MPVEVAANRSTIIQAANFDSGGEGISYHNPHARRVWHTIRKMEGIDIGFSDGRAFGYDVTDISAGEWLNYTVNFATASSYKVAFHMASQAGGGKFHLEVDGHNATELLTVPKTRSQHKWTQVSGPGVSLTAGRHVLTLVFDSTRAHALAGSIDYFSISPPLRSRKS